MVRGEVQTVTKTDVLADFESQPTILGCFRVNFAENLAGGGFYPTRSGNFLVRLRHLLIRLFNHPSRSGGVRVGWGDGPLVAARNQLGVSGHSGVVELEGIAGVGVAGDGNLLSNHPVADEELVFKGDVPDRAVFELQLGAVVNDQAHPMRGVVNGVEWGR